MSSQVKVAIIGANGYTGEELCRLLLAHPRVEIVALTSRQHAGKPLAQVLPKCDRKNGPALTFIEPKLDALLASDAELFFLSLPHGVASEFAVPLLKAGKKVLDLSADFRLRDAAVYEEFYDHAHPAPELLAQAVYGLPEIYRKEIAQSSLVACPGCYPTSILLPLIPLLKASLLDPKSIIVSSASGVSGAGRKAEESLLYSECNESFRAYGVPKHRHLSEIEQELSLAADAPTTITFVPHLAPMTRGIHSLMIAQPTAAASAAIIQKTLKDFYADEPFVRVVDRMPDTKYVTGTNLCEISSRWDARTGRVLLFSAEDNLIKGAGGQGVQCLNLVCGFPETEGLL